MSINQSVYVGPYIKAKAQYDDTEAWYTPYDENGNPELTNREIFIPNFDSILKEVGGMYLGYSGIVNLPPLNSAADKYLAKFKEVDPNAELNFGVIIWWS